MTINFEDKDGAQALDQEQFASRWQFSVQSGCEVSPGTDDMTVQVASGSIFFDGDSVDVAAQDNVPLAASDSTYPRKDVVYLDGNGDLQVATGGAEAAVPTGEVRFKTRRPAPPDLSATAATVVAEVWVPAGASDISSADVRDRRQEADISVNKGSFTEVNADEVNNGRSGRFGDLVYYDPADSGPYVDGADALDDVPAGGTFRLATGTYDPATEGRLETNLGVSILGSGASQDDNGAAFGTKLFNTSGAPLDQPIIEVSDPDGRAGGPVEVGNFQMRHHGPTTAGVRFENHTFGYAHDIAANQQGIGASALRYGQSSFFAWAERVATGGDIEAGIDFQMNGSQNYAVQCKTDSSGETGAIGLRFGTSGYAFGGQHEGDAAGIQFDNQAGNAIAGGGVFRSLVEVSDPAIDITGANEWNSLRIFEPTIDCNDGATAVRFDNATACDLIRPTIKAQNLASPLYEFTANSEDNQIKTDYYNIVNASVTDSGALNSMEVRGALGDARLGNLPTALPIHVEMDSNRGYVPVIYDPDAGTWRETSSTTFTP